MVNGLRTNQEEISLLWVDMSQYYITWSFIIRKDNNNDLLVKIKKKISEMFRDSRDILVRKYNETIVEMLIPTDVVTEEFNSLKKKYGLLRCHLDLGIKY